MEKTKSILSYMMNKDISLKTFIISNALLLVFGLMVLGWLYYVLHGDNLPLLGNNKVANYIPVTREPISFNLEISNPEDESLVYAKSIVVSGKTSSNATVIVSSGGSDHGLEANSKGDFSQVLVLTPGLNRIRVNAFENKGNNKEVQRVIYYSEEKLEDE